MRTMLIAISFQLTTPTSTAPDIQIRFDGCIASLRAIPREGETCADDDVAELTFPVLRGTLFVPLPHDIHQIECRLSDGISCGVLE